jgi:hypothetical protein
MNELLASRYSEVVHRLAAGIEPIDAIGGGRAGTTARVSLEYPHALAGARPLAHAGGRWSIRYVPKLPDHVDIRIEDAARHFVPRRLRLPIVDEATVRAHETAGDVILASQRTWRPALFPGAAYPVAASATGIRGRVHRLGGAARWARVEASVGGEVLWRAHGDDRGEFLLVVGPNPHAAAELPEVLTITLAVFAALPPAVPPAAGPDDPLWDLPLQTVMPPGPDDAVSSGVTLPPGFDAATFSGEVNLVPGRITTGLAPFDLV